jgi:WD40 repeat protein
VTNPYLVVSGSDDGYLKCWDVRAAPGAKAALSIKFGEEISDISLGAHDLLIAAATGNAVKLFDTRCIRADAVGSSSGSNGAFIGEYSDVHTKDIGAVKFHPLRRNELFTAAEDGLVCCYDTSVASGGNTVLSVVNAECDVRAFGFFGPRLDGLYCLSTVETASFWHAYSALRIVDLPQVREEHQLDYLVTCLPGGFGDDTGDEGDALQLLAGNNDGTGVLFDVSPGGNGAGGLRRTKGGTLRGGHSDVIRCATPLGSPNNGSGRMVTGGEDSLLCVYTL